MHNQMARAFKNVRLIGCRSLLLAVPALLVVAMAMPQAGATNARTTSAARQTPAANLAVEAARDQIGDDYEWGEAGPDAFDAAGLAMFAWGEAGVTLPHSSAAQKAMVRPVGENHLRPGDLLFFYNPVHHVAIYIGNGRMVHAENENGGVNIDRLGGYYTRVFSGAGRPTL